MLQARMAALQAKQLAIDENAKKAAAWDAQPPNPKKGKAVAWELPPAEPAHRTGGMVPAARPVEVKGGGKAQKGGGKVKGKEPRDDVDSIESASTDPEVGFAVNAGEGVPGCDRRRLGWGDSGVRLPSGHGKGEVATVGGGGTNPGGGVGVRLPSGHGPASSSGAEGSAWDDVSVAATKETAGGKWVVPPPLWIDAPLCSCRCPCLYGLESEGGLGQWSRCFGSLDKSVATGPRVTP